MDQSNDYMTGRLRTYAALLNVMADSLLDGTLNELAAGELLTYTAACIANGNGLLAAKLLLPIATKQSEEQLRLAAEAAQAAADACDLDAMDGEG